MTQWEFDTILKVLEVGTPTLYQTLGNSLNTLVIDKNSITKENEELRAKVAKLEENRNVVEVSQSKASSTKKKS